MFAAVDPISAATQEFWCNVRTEFKLLGIKTGHPLLLRVTAVFMHESHILIPQEVCRHRWASDLNISAQWSTALCRKSFGVQLFHLVSLIYVGITTESSLQESMQVLSCPCLWCNHCLLLKEIYDIWNPHSQCAGGESVQHREVAEIFVTLP